MVAFSNDQNLATKSSSTKKTVPKKDLAVWQNSVFSMISDTERWCCYNPTHVIDKMFVDFFGGELEEGLSGDEA